MTSTFRHAALAILALYATASHAALSAADHPVFGSGALTISSQHSLAWLTPRVTVGLSYTEVATLLQGDSRFAGYRFATLQELEGLFQEAGIPDINVPGYGALYGTTANVPAVDFLQSLIGVTYTTQVAGVTVVESAGFLGSPYLEPVNGFVSAHLGNIVLRSGVQTDSGVQSFASAYSPWGSLPVGAGTVGVGSWLVSAVPEPSTSLLLSLGLLGLPFLRQRIKA